MDNIQGRELTDAMKTLYNLMYVLGYHDLADIKRELSLLDQAITMRQGELMADALKSKQGVK